MSTEERDELFRLVMQYHDGELPPGERDRIESFIASSPEAQAWLADMEAMGDATWEFVREAVEGEDFSEYWVTIDEGVRSPTPELRRRKRKADEQGVMAWVRRTFGTWLAPTAGLAVAGAAAMLVLAVGLPWALRTRSSPVTEVDWAGMASIDNTLEIEDISGEDWAVSIVAVGQDQPMIIWLDDLAAGGDQG